MQKKNLDGQNVFFQSIINHTDQWGKSSLGASKKKELFACQFELNNLKRGWSAIKNIVPFYAFTFNLDESSITIN